MAKEIGQTLKVKAADGKVKSFTKDSCSSSKDAATNKAKSIRNEGKTARVVKDGAKYCVFVGAKAKPKGRKKA